MNIVKTYGNYIKKYAGTHPAVSRKMIDIGLHLEQFRTEHFAEKTMPKAYQKLNTLGVKIRFMRWNTRNPRSGVICLHQWKFSSASDSVRFPWNAFPRFSQDLRAKTILSTAQKAVELPPRSVPITKILSVP